MTKTRGGIIVENIKIGDIHYEFEYGHGIKSIVISLPVKEIQGDGDEYWTWQSKHDLSDTVINYGVSKNHSHYGPNLYDYEAYIGVTYI